MGFSKTLWTPLALVVIIIILRVMFAQEKSRKRWAISMSNFLQKGLTLSRTKVVKSLFTLHGPKNMPWQATSGHPCYKW